MVEKSDVRKQWPFGQVSESKTGLPGRPALAKHLIEDELRRRASLGALAPTLAEEATALLEWLRESYREDAPPTVHTIENNIRAEYRHLKAMKIKDR